MSDQQTPTQNMQNDDSLLEDSRIIIRGNKVIIENLTEDLLDLALALNPSDSDLVERKNALNAHKTGENNGTL